MKASDAKTLRLSGRVGVYIVAAAYLAFCLTWWNRSLSPVLSGDLFYGFAWRHGLIPYRDYYFGVGLGTAAVMGWSFLALWRARGVRAAVRWGATAVGSWIVPWAIALVWLNGEGVLGAFFDSVFFRGPKAKGSLLGTFLRPISLTLDNGYLRPAAVLSLVIVAIAVCSRWRPLRRGLERASPILPPLLVAAAAIAGVAELIGPDSRRLALTASYLAMIADLALLLRSFASLRSPSRRTIQIGLLAALGFSASYSLSISWAAFEVMMFPALSLPVAVALEASPAGRGRRELRLIAGGACAALVISIGASKARHPQSFMSWEEPPLAVSDTTPQSQGLEGFVLSEPTARFYDSIAALIDEHSKPDDRVFVYPAMTALYAIANRLPATFAVSHLPDVCPDWIAAEDAQRILRSPPAVIVFEDLGEGFYTNQERWFRGGRESGNRLILRALETLKPRYRILNEAVVGRRTHAAVEVWVLQR
ncbi:MAG: hypothetical protein LC689_09185 [Myxococcales bacterium]|nr:hypothetical protein [Myxococcales bacterium]